LAQKKEKARVFPSETTISFKRGRQRRTFGLDGRRKNEDWVHIFEFSVEGDGNPKSAAGEKITEYYGNIRDFQIFKKYIEIFGCF
jgi:hypothetical protein